MPVIDRRGRRAVVVGSAIASLFAGGALLALSSTTARAALVHEYTFATVNDSVGTANGTLINGATVSGGSLVTAGGGSGSAGTAPALNLSGAGATTGLTGDLTLENFWTRTAGQTTNFSTLFSFAAGATDTNNYVIATPQRNDGRYSTAIKQAGVNGGGEVVLESMANLVTGVQHQSVTTYNAATGTAIVYVDGIAQARSPLLSGLNFSNFGVKAGISGQAPYGDPGFVGTQAEFRINNDTVAPGTVAEHFLAGPDALTVTANASTADGDYSDASIFNGGAPTTGQLVTINNNVAQTSGTGNAGLLRVANGGTLAISGGTTNAALALDVSTGGTVNLSAGGTLKVAGVYGDGQFTSAGQAGRVINFNGGTYQAGTNFINAGTSVTANVNAPTALDSNGFTAALPVALTGGSVTNSVTKVGTGTMVISGDLSAYNGALNIQVGTLEMLAPASRTVAGGNPINVPINFDPTNSGVASQLTINQVTPIDLNGTLTVAQPSVATAYSVVGTGIGQNGNITGKITGGNANSTLSYTGFFKVTGTTNDYAGKTQFNGGTSIAVNNPNVFGNSSLVFNNGGIEGLVAMTGANKIPNSGTINSTNAAAQPMFINGNNDIELAGNFTSGATDVAANEIQKGGLGKIILDGNVTIGGNAGLNNVTGTGGTVANPRVFQVNGTLTSTGTGRFLYVDTGGGNSNGETEYAAMANGATINGLTLFVKGRATNTNISDRPVSGLILDSISGNNTLAAGISIRATGGGYSIRSQAGSTLTIGTTMSGNVSGATPREFELTGAGAGIINANVANTNGATPTLVGLFMVGETTGSDTTGKGKWALNSTGNAFTGGISVADGTLLVNGSTTATAVLATNVASVYGGVLGGTGSIAQPITVYAPNSATVQLVPGTAGGPNTVAYTATSNNNKGGTLAPGNDATPIGTLTAVKAVVINGVLSIQVDDTGAGSSDKLAAQTSLALGSGSTLNVSDLGAGVMDDAYIIASYPAGTLTGTFATTNLPTGYSVDYNYQGLNQIALVPEPATLGAIVGLAGLAMGRRRR